RKHFEWPGQQVPEPRVGVTESRLAGFQTNHARDDGPVYLPADAGNQFAFHFVLRRNQDVTRGRADDFTEVVRLDLPTYGTHVAIKGADTHDHVGGQPQLFGPFST